MDTREAKLKVGHRVRLLSRLCDMKKGHVGYITRVDHKYGNYYYCVDGSKFGSRSDSFEKVDFIIGDRVVQVIESEWEDHNFDGVQTIAEISALGGIKFEGSIKTNMPCRFALDTCSVCPSMKDVTLGNFVQKGMKFSENKLKWSLVTRDLIKPLTAVAAVVTYGSKKYSERNWRKVTPRLYEDALDRHMAAWRTGESVDEDTGILHLAHATCNILFLLYFATKDTPYDDLTKFNDPTLQYKKERKDAQVQD